jgi:fucose permease
MTRFAALVAGSLGLAAIFTATSEPLIEILVNLIILASGIGILKAASSHDAQEQDAEAG